MRTLVLKNGFKNKENEIAFFKDIKPRTHSWLIYYVNRFNIETKIPKGNRKTQIKYLNNIINNLQEFLHDNLEFYQYYCSNATYLDEHYFLRKHVSHRLYTETPYSFTDKKFSTNHDRILATIMANDELIHYLLTIIQKLKNKKTMNEINKVFQKKRLKLYWTGTYSEFIEVSYALHASGRINNGNIDKKELILSLQELFNIENNNYYDAFSDIRNRKINVSKFLDTLKEAFLRYIKDLDDLKKK